MNSEPILFESLFLKLPCEDFKIHVAQRSGKTRSTDVIAEGRSAHVGLAYGNEGIWSGGSRYLHTGAYGGNKVLKTLLKPKTKGARYINKIFQFSLL